MVLRTLTIANAANFGLRHGMFKPSSLLSFCLDCIPLLPTEVRSVGSSAQDQYRTPTSLLAPRLTSSLWGSRLKSRACQYRCRSGVGDRYVEIEVRQNEMV